MNRDFFVNIYAAMRMILFLKKWVIGWERSRAAAQKLPIFKENKLQKCVT